MKVSHHQGGKVSVTVSQRNSGEQAPDWGGQGKLSQIMKEIVVVLRCLQYHGTALGDVESFFCTMASYGQS